MMIYHSELSDQTTDTTSKTITEVIQKQRIKEETLHKHCRRPIKNCRFSPRENPNSARFQ